MRKVYLKRARSRKRSPDNAGFFRQSAGKEGGGFFAASAGPSFFQPSMSGVHRKCDGCAEEENKVQKKEGSQSSGSAASHAYISNIGSKGQPLPQAQQQFFGSRMGHNFSNVKIHTGPEAGRSAAGLNALAYTYGNNIVFNEKQYEPGTHQGQKLLAHELVHVVQQSGHDQPKSLQRVPAGFDIRGVYPHAASYPDTIFFDMGSSVIPPSELGKIPALATPPGQDRTLIGTSSEEGTAGANTTLINNRIGHVSGRMHAAGHTGPRRPAPQLTASEGNMDYRKVRAVEVINTPAVVPPGGPMPSTSPPCAVTPANPTPEVEPCGTSFVTAFPLALTWAVNAFGLVSAGDPAALAHVPALFPGIPVPTVLGHLNNIWQQIARLPGQHRCHNTCDGGCRRPAYNRGTGSSSMMTLCPGYINNTNIPDNAETLVHESIHATPGLATADVAYSTTRLVQTLTGAQALNNTDSFVLLILRINGLASSGGVPATDTFVPGNMLPAEEATTRSALAYLEQWLLNAEFDTSLLYTAINGNIGRAGGWDPTDGFNAETMHRIAAFAGLTDPGPSPYATTPVADDKIKVAGMFDRYTSLRQAVYMVPVAATKVPAGPDSWGPGLAPSVSLTAPFFALAPVDAVRFLLRLLIRSLGTVPAGLIDAYVNSADQIRGHRGTGP
jgi:hypothetical protein